jgi:hypothetical protein
MVKFVAALKLWLFFGNEMKLSTRALSNEILMATKKWRIIAIVVRLVFIIFNVTEYPLC